MHRRRARLFIAFASAIIALLPFVTRSQDVTPVPADPAQSVLDFIAAQPTDAAFMCIEFNQPPEAAIVFNADERFPLASVFKIVILAEYARQVDAGALNPSEAVPLAELNAFWLPGTDGDAHQRFLDSLPPDSGSVTLAQIADAMITYSSNAAPDYLLNRMGTAGFPALYGVLGLQHTDLPGSYLGLILALKNHETGSGSTLDAARFAAEAERLATLYRTDPGWRDAEIAFQTAEREKSANLTLEQSAGIILEQQRFYEQFGAHGSARDMVSVLRAAYQPGVLPDGARAIMRQHLNWLFTANPDNIPYYDELAWKNGIWAGLLASVWYISPKGGQPFALAAFYRNMPLETWADWAFGSLAPQMLELEGIQTGGCAVYADRLGQ